MGLVVKNLSASADVEDVGSVLGCGGPPVRGHSSRLQYSCLKNPMDRGACHAIVHGVTKSMTRLKRLSTAHHILKIDKQQGLTIYHKELHSIKYNNLNGKRI